jgi:polyphosphate kinase 2 (PPK2 family)
MIENRIILLKYWLEVSNEEQARRFRARIDDPLRQWKRDAAGSAGAVALSVPGRHGRE